MTMKNAALGLMVFGVLGSVSRAEGQCNSDVPMVNTVVNDALWPGAIQDWNEWYEEFDVYRLEGGIDGISTATSSTRNKHILAIILLHYGVKGAAPFPEQILGTWTFSPPPNKIIAHRSVDEYAPVTYGTGNWAWDEIRPDGSLGRGAYMHGGQRMRMVPGSSPWAANGWDITFDSRPERRIDYSCQAFSKPSAGVLGMDAVGLAGVTVHEALHTTGLGHSDSPIDLCTEPGDVCDTYVPNTRPSPKGGIVGHVYPPFGAPARIRTPISVGSNQGGAEYYCDLAAAPDDWVPVMASLVAQGLYETMANLSRWINVRSLPFTCGPREGLLRQAGYGECTPKDINAPVVCRPELGGADCLAGSGQTCGFPDGVCSNDPSVICSTHGECQNSLSDLGATCDADLPTCPLGVCTNGSCTDPAGQCVGEGQCCVVVK